MGKSLNEWGVLVKEEGSYGGGGSPSASTDGVLVNERPDVDMGYLHDGARRGETGPMSQGLQGVKKSGRQGTVSLIHEAAGGGAAYSASVKPSVHTLLSLAGFDATLDASAGTEKYTYTPGDGASGVAELYTREQMVTLTGMLADLTVGADGPEVPVWEFAVSALAALPVEDTVPAITYPSIMPPKAESMVLTMGDFASAVVRRHSLTLGRVLQQRADQNSGGHAGFKAGAIVPVLEVDIEAEDFVADPYHAAGGINPYQLAELATALDLSWQYGSEQYNRFKFTAPAAQLEPIGEGEDGPAGLWTLRFMLMPTTPGAKDGLEIVAD